MIFNKSYLRHPLVSLEKLRTKQGAAFLLTADKLVNTLDYRNEKSIKSSKIGSI